MSHGLPAVSVQGTVSYSSDEEEAASDPRRRDPFATTRDHLAQAGAQQAPRPRSEFAGRAAAFWATLKSEDGLIDEAVVRAYLFDYGCPEQPAGARGLLWKLLLGYLPWDRRKWAESLATQRATYEGFVQELTANPFVDGSDDDPLGAMAARASPSPASPAAPASSSSSVKTTLRFSKISPMDDPLSTPSVGESSWTKYYKDNSIREEIQKDVQRTYSTFHFFIERVRPIESSAEAVRASDAQERARAAAEAVAARGGAGTNLFAEHNLRASTRAKDTGIPPIPKVECASSTRRAADETHHDVIKRILFIFAKLNPGIRYVQGMNELLAPLYYVFAHNGNDLRSFHPETGEEDPSDVLARECVSALFGAHTAEADAFFCFTAVMSHMRDRFIKSLDLAPTGVLAVIANLNGLLKRIDHQLWAHLQTIAVDPRFYSFRWLTLMLSQEFELPDVLRLWDALFAAEPEASREGTDELAAAEAMAKLKLAGPPGSPSALAAEAAVTAAEASTKQKLIVEFLNDVCCGMLVTLRKTLLAADFSIALKLLQSAGAGIDLQRLLFKAAEIRRIRRANGGFVVVSPKTPSPAPLTTAQQQQDFTTSQPRPGDAPKPRQQATHIPLLNALTSPPAPPAAALAPPPQVQTMSPVPSAAEDSSESPAATPTSSSSSSSTPSLAGVLSGAGALAGGLVHAIERVASSAAQTIATATANTAATPAPAASSAASLAAPSTQESAEEEVTQPVADASANVEHAATEPAPAPQSASMDA